MKKSMQGPVPTPTPFAPGGYAATSNPSVSGTNGRVATVPPVDLKPMSVPKGTGTDERKPTISGAAAPDGGLTPKPI